jgi:hypothetical protein
MVVNYRGKEIEISDKFGTEWGEIFGYMAAYGADENGTNYVVLWQKRPDENAEDGYTYVFEEPMYAVKDYCYKLAGTFAGGEEWDEYAEDFLDFCDELKKIIDNPCAFLEKIVALGDCPFADAPEEEILNEILWRYNYIIDFGNDETVITFSQD